MAIELPEIGHIPRGIRKGRSVYDGYARGVGMQHGKLLDQVRADPEYQSCASLADGRSIQIETNRVNIFLLIRFFLPKVARGNIIEFGSYRGGSALFMAAAAKRYLPGCRVFACDTFEGMPQTDNEVDLHVAGDFNEVDLDEIRTLAAKHELDNIEFVKGRFEDTFDSIADRVGPLSLVHIDCDIRSAVAYSYERTKALMVKGGYWVFDDALASTCIGATEAIEEILIQRDQLLSEQIYPHYVFRAGLE